LVRSVEAWEGTVVGKSRGMLDGANIYHFPTVQKAGGGVDKVGVKRSLWKAVAEGDALVKRPGELPRRG
jgi:hypothetical protein